MPGNANARAFRGPDADATAITAHHEVLTSGGGVVGGATHVPVLQNSPEMQVLPQEPQFLVSV